MKQSVLFIFAVFSLMACEPAPKNTIEAKAQEYFNVYTERQSFERFIAFYAPNAVLKDIVSGEEFEGKDKIQAFLDWSKGDFVMPEQGKLMSVDKQIVKGNTVVTQGTFHAFTYNGQSLGPWEFVIVQEYNDAQLIIKQSDWINYAY